MKRQVVINEHTFAILNDQTKRYEVLRALVTKGATWEYLPEPKILNSWDKVRDATDEDFEKYGIYKSNHDLI